MTGRVATKHRFKNQASERRGCRSANVMRRNRAGPTAAARAQSAIWPTLGRNIVDRRSRRVEGIVGGGKAGRQGRGVETVAAGDATEPGRQRFGAKGLRRDGKTSPARQRRAS